MGREGLHVYLQSLFTSAVDEVSGQRHSQDAVAPGRNAGND
jgi:hypothetical protein